MLILFDENISGKKGDTWRGRALNIINRVVSQWNLEGVRLLVITDHPHVSGDIRPHFDVVVMKDGGAFLAWQGESYEFVPGHLRPLALRLTPEEEQARRRDLKERQRELESPLPPPHDTESRALRMAARAEEKERQRRRGAAWMVLGLPEKLPRRHLIHVCPTPAELESLNEVAQVVDQWSQRIPELIPVEEVYWCEADDA
ncbi:unnamed protein product [Sympodiomycopsis kandeliae]